MRALRLASRALVLVLGLTAALPAVRASSDDHGASAKQFESTTRPIDPWYRVHPDGSATVRICFNWSCASRQAVTFTAAELDEVGRQMSLCRGDGLAERLQRLRIGIWQLEALAEKHQPLLANDGPVNDSEYALEGRMDCVDNATNTTTYASLLRELGLLSGWSVQKPRVRDPLSLDVHWSATVVDERSGAPWAVDSWFYGNGTLPFVVPLADWTAGRTAWEPPLASFNPYPPNAAELCPNVETAAGSSAGLEIARSRGAGHLPGSRR